MTIHILGGGLAGLTAALCALEAGARVVLHEAAPHLGGRARSFMDPLLNRVIDNGTHVILGANQRVMTLLRRIGAEGALLPVVPDAIPFFDLATKAWEEYTPTRMKPVPRRRLAFAVDCLRLLRAAGRQTVAEVLETSPHYRNLWQPMAVAVMNSEERMASAKVFGKVVRRTLLAGPDACRAFVPAKGLSQALADPLLARITELGGEVRLNSRVTALGGKDSCTSLAFKGAYIELQPSDRVILAVPAWEAARLIALPKLETRAIANIHFRLDRPAIMNGGRRFAGVLGGTAHWFSCRGDTLSATVSAWDDSRPDDGRLALQVWAEAQQVLNWSPGSMPLHRVLIERRATILHSPENERSRPSSKTAWSNFFLAGDYTATGLPCTIEGAVISGETAARLALRRW